MALPTGRTLTHPNSNSSSRRKRLLFKVMLWIALALSAYQVLWTYWLAGVGIPDVEIDKTTGQKKVRRRPDLLVKRDHTTGQDVPT